MSLIKIIILFFEIPLYGAIALIIYSLKCINHALNFTNGVNTATFIKITYVETPSTPAIPATAATDENPAALAIAAKDAVHVMVPFKDLLYEE